MNDMLHMVEILEDILRADNPVAEARMQRKKLLFKLEQLEAEMIEDIRGAYDEPFVS